MRKHILTTSLIFIYLLPAFSQNANTIWIDSLKKRLSSLHDSAQVDGLNELSDAFRTMGPYPALDSVHKYAIAANREAIKLGYKKGEAFSLLSLTGGETYIKKAISIGESVKDAKILGRSFLALSYGLKGEPRIEALKKALGYFEQTNDWDGQIEANELLCNDYTSNAKYDEGFRYCDRCEQLIKGATFTPWGHEWALWYFQNMADLYQRAGENETSLEYLRQGNQYARKYQVSWNLDLNIITVFTQLGLYDSAFYYWKQFENNASPYVLNHREFWIGVLGEIYLKTKQYNKALDIAHQGIVFFKKQKSTGFALTGHLLAAAKIYAEMKNYKTALPYAKEGVTLAERNNMLSSIIEGYQLLADIYYHLGNNRNAYDYLSQYHTLKDSVQNRRFLLRLYNFKLEAQKEKQLGQINLLNKENQLKESKLKQQMVIRNSLIIGLILLLVTGIFLFRTLHLKRRNEILVRQQLENELRIHQLQAVELEMQVLRAQMNPHFIFNCLSSINRFILKNEARIASNYLTRFSRLMRMVLQNSQKKFITLEDELQMLRLYLEMERLRFKNTFDYRITFLNEIDADNIFIPPLILQPFCENAIWHGLMHKDDQGVLSIDLKMEKGVLNCIITDNGVGREKADELKSKTAEKQKSFGLQITADRLALLNKNMQTALYEIEDIKDGNGNPLGTRVTIKISIETLTDELVVI